MSLTVDDMDKIQTITVSIPMMMRCDPDPLPILTWAVITEVPSA